YFFSRRRRHTRFSRDWSSDVCSSDLTLGASPNQWKTAGVPGLEPRVTVPETVVLPITPSPNDCQGEDPVTRISACFIRTGSLRRSEERSVGKEYRCVRWPVG